MFQRRAAFLVDAQGQRHPLQDRFVIGRARECDLSLNSGRVARHHVVFTRLVDDAFEASDHQTTNGTYVNQERLTHRRLVEGDVVELDALRWRFERGPELAAPAEDPALALLARTGDDEAAFRVAVDALLEGGHALGARLAAGAPWELPQALQHAEREGVLLVERRAGAPRRVRIRPHAFTQERDLLFALLTSGVADLLTSLTLPGWSPRWGLEGARVPSLRQLRFGPFFSTSAAQACAEALAGVRFEGMPQLVSPEVESYGTAWLDFGADQRRPLSPGRKESFTSFSVRWENGAWLAQLELSTQRLWVNRVSRASVVLLPGDHLRSGNISCTFRAG
jgi:hypothetical protein